MEPLEFLDDMHGIFFVQPGGPGTVCHPLFCHNVDGVDMPSGDMTTSIAQNALKQWVAASRSQGGPSAATLTLDTWLAKTRGWLQQMYHERCPFGLYYIAKPCPPSNNILNYDTGQQFQDFTITGASGSNMALQATDEGASATKTGLGFDGNAKPMPYWFWKLVESRHAVAEDQELRDVTFCTIPGCAGECGDRTEVCTDGVAVADAAAVAIADVWITRDLGVTWTAAAAQPFIADEDINSVVCFLKDSTTTRIIVQRGTTDAANPGEIAYSDDWGVTWALVNVGATNGEYGMHSGGLFAFDPQHIWAVTDLGNVYFSDDGGATWTDQGAPDPGAGAEELYYVHFVDYRYGWAVGDNQHMMTTSDGGDHWTIVATPPGSATDVFTCVATLDRYRAWVGSTNAAGTAGYLYLTTDAGATWTNFTARLQAAENFPGGTITHIGDVQFIDQYNGAVCGNLEYSATDYIVTFRTFNGGHDWEMYFGNRGAFDLDSAVSYQGANALWMCGPNHLFVVGEVVDLTAFIGELTPAGSV